LSSFLTGILVAASAMGFLLTLLMTEISVKCCYFRYVRSVFFDLDQESSTIFCGSLLLVKRCGAVEVEMRLQHIMLVAAIASLSLMPRGQGEAQEIGQPSRGLALAQRLCADCHAIQKEYARSPNANAPRFQAIASTPGMTAIALSAALNTSHHSMPNILLAADEQADVIAYILSLK
jgi:mono/diheme cytochrome c family protein